MKYHDPYRDREAKKYGRPIPSRELILQILSKSNVPFNFRRIAKELSLSKSVDLKALRRRLRAMERDGQLLFNRRKKYVPISRADLIAGRVMGHPDGFGFLIPDDGGTDLFLSAKQMRQLLHGDRALVSLVGINARGKREGMVVEVLQHNTTQIVGRYFIEGKIGFVVPDNKRISQDIFIPPKQARRAKVGQIVVVAITEHANQYSQPVGKIIEILGEHHAPGMEIEIALRSHELPYKWPHAIKQASKDFTTEVQEQDKLGRIDLREIPLVTIDGKNAKDFDDAVYCEREGNHWRLLVAIADVSHYVNIGDALDQEAWQRGTSVYFPQQVIPMLPTVLSNNLCSLKPKVDRLCLVCDMRITPHGKVLNYEFKEAIMHSAARLTYKKMAKIVVQRKVKTRKKQEKIVKHLDDLYTLYKILRQAKQKQGAIAFESNETRIIFSKDRKIKAIEAVKRNDAHKLIEVFMILANVCAAKFLHKHKIPCLHRVHQGPTVEKITDLRQFLAGIGLSLTGGDKPEPTDYSQLLQQISERADKQLIQTVLLRSLSQAVYTPDVDGHFGLARQHYTHFTSPIRRYPDLLVHRAIRHLIQGNPAKKFTYNYNDMVVLGEHCSATERRAEDASRDVIAWLKAEYMQDKIGENFTGIISTVTGFGLFIQLDNIHVEGLVHVTALSNDYYHFDPIRHQLVGEHSGKKYRLGDVIEIKVARVDLDERKIDFMLTDTKLS